MNILALDTATDACSVALYGDAGAHQRHVVEPRRHAEIIFALIDDVLRAGGIDLDAIDAIGFGRGPGSFTGVRIAASVVQGICLARALPVIGVSSLEVIAHAASRIDDSARVMAGLDARRGELYCAAYEVHHGDNPNGTVCHLGDTLLAPQDVRLPDDGPWLCAGNAWNIYREQVPPAVRRAPCSTVLYPQALDLARLAAQRYADGETQVAGEALPIYLRGATD